MAPEIITTAAAGAGGGLGLAAGIYLFKWLLEWVAGRMDKRSDQIDAATARLIDRLETQVRELIAQGHERDEKIRRLEEKVEECEIERAELRAEVLQLKAFQQAQGDARQVAQLIVSNEKLAAKRRETGV